MDIVISILAWAALASVGLFMLLSPKSDKRYKTGNKDNAADGPGCFIGFALIVGLLAGVLNKFFGSGVFFDLDALFPFGL